MISSNLTQIRRAVKNISANVITGGDLQKAYDEAEEIEARAAELKSEVNFMQRAMKNGRSEQALLRANGIKEKAI